MEKVDVGQTLYVTVMDMFSERESNLKECVIERVNSNSVYVGSKDGLGKTIRLDRNKLVSTDGFMHCRYKAYLNSEDYWVEIAIRTERKELQKNIETSLHSLDIKELRLIKELLDKKAK